MTYPANRPGRVGQGKYWTVFGINMITVPVMLFGGAYAVLSGAFGIGILAILLILPVGIYFRVTMMRRCRDIGWPAFLPWLLFALPIAFGFLGGLGRIGASGAAPSLATMAVPLLISAGDFVFSIVIGCIATKDEDSDYSDIFGGEAIPARPIGAPAPRADPPRYEAPRQAARDISAPGEPDYSRFDAAIAKALEQHQRSQGDAASRPEPGAHARAVAGFGRKAI